MAKYECDVCGFIYDEELGFSEENIVAGTKWSEVIDSFICPLCGVGKDTFSKIL